jgi:hypothetical protein
VDGSQLAAKPDDSMLLLRARTFACGTLGKRRGIAGANRRSWFETCSEAADRERARIDLGRRGALPADVAEPWLRNDAR